jgi:hypothetical protein
MRVLSRDGDQAGHGILRCRPGRRRTTLRVHIRLAERLRANTRPALRVETRDRGAHHRQRARDEVDDPSAGRIHGQHARRRAAGARSVHDARVVRRPREAPAVHRDRGHWQVCRADACGTRNWLVCVPLLTRARRTRPSTTG